MIGEKQGDTRMIGISNELRDMIQSRKFNNLFENNVPYAGFEKVNLLKTIDLGPEMQAKLLNKGLGDLLHHPSAQIISSAIIKENIDMKYEEENPQFKASEFTITFSGYRTPQACIDPSNMPKRFSFKFRFFTFNEETTDHLALVSDGNMAGKPSVERDTPYFLQKVSQNDPTIEVLPSKDLRENIVSCTFLIDPSKSRIAD